MRCTGPLPHPTTHVSIMAWVVGWGSGLAWMAHPKSNS